MTDDPDPRSRLAACLDAVGAREGDLRAFRALDVDGAEAALEETAHGPLRGLVVGVEDVIDTADMPTRYGSPIYERHMPVASAPVVEAVRAAGGVVLGKTETTEFARLTPAPTRNPHDETRSPGGSSSGSAAAVAAGMVEAALGVQTGGSIIRPAAFCGVVGYKPSFDLIPAVGVKTVSWTLDTLGVFARRLETAALLAGVCADRDLTPRIAPRPPRLGLYAPEGADADAAEALDRAVEALREAGASIERASPPAAFARLDAAWRVVNDREGARSLSYERRVHGAALSDALRAALDLAAALPANAYEEALATAAAARAQSVTMTAGFDAVLTYAAPGRATPLASTGDARFNRLWTLIGGPAISLPIPRALRGQGLPLGLQLVGARLSDRTTLNAAAWVEGALLNATGAYAADEARV